MEKRNRAQFPLTSRLRSTGITRASCTRKSFQLDVLSILFQAIIKIYIQINRIDFLRFETTILAKEYNSGQGKGPCDSPSITYTMDPTSPSRMMVEPAEKVTGYMQSTISRICVSSKFFMKSLSKMAALIRSRDLRRKKESDTFLSKVSLLIVRRLLETSL